MRDLIPFLPFIAAALILALIAIFFGWNPFSRREEEEPPVEVLPPKEIDDKLVRELEEYLRTLLPPKPPAQVIDLPARHREEDLLKALEQALLPLPEAKKA